MKPDKSKYEKGFRCPHCGSYNRMYTRKLNANMCFALLLLYKQHTTEFVKVEDLLIKQGKKRCGDFSYLRFYGFLESMQGKRDDGSPRTGYYKITQKGIDFCNGIIKASESFMILHNNFEGFKGREIDIREALGTSFNYDELMSNGRPKPKKKDAVPSIPVNQNPLFDLM